MIYILHINFGEETYSRAFSQGQEGGELGFPYSEQINACFAGKGGQIYLDLDVIGPSRLICCVGLFSTYRKQSHILWERAWCLVKWVQPHVY